MQSRPNEVRKLLNGEASSLLLVGSKWGRGGRNVGCLLLSLPRENDGFVENFIAIYRPINRVVLPFTYVVVAYRIYE